MPHAKEKLKSEISSLLLRAEDYFRRKNISFTVVRKAYSEDRAHLFVFYNLNALADLKGILFLDFKTGQVSNYTCIPYEIEELISIIGSC